MALKMKQVKPQYRFVTNEAKQKLTYGLNLPESNCQDWEYTIGNPADINKYIEYYKNHAIDDNQKFALMEIIIQAIEDQKGTDRLLYYWSIIVPLLNFNFDIHKYSIYYWACFDNNLEDSWRVSSLMRDLFTTHTNR